MKIKATITLVLLWGCGLLLGGCGHLKTNSETASSPANETTLPDQPGDISTEPVTSPESEGTRDNPEVVPPADAIASADLFARIRKGFKLPDLNSKYIKEYEHWNATHPTYLNNLFARAEPFLFHIVEEIEKRDLPMELVLLPAVESAYKPNAVSRSRAAGLWQFIPSTGRGFGLRQDWWYDGRRDVIASTDAALDYLTQLNKMFDGDWFLALAAYNAGPGTVSRSIKANKKRSKGTDYQSIRLRSETRRYVPKLIALKNIVENPEKFGVQLPRIENAAQFEVLTLPSQIDLHEFAEKSNIPATELQHLNAGFRRWATAPDGPHRIIIPLGSAAAATAARSAIEQAPLIQYRNHRIARGDTLSTIARTYGVSINALQTSNNLRGSSIRAGKDLLIPIRGVPATQSTRALGAETGGQKLVHKVQRGDTLWSIARHYKVRLQELISWNNLSSDQILRLNQSLLVFTN